jgi:hypothetical protein
MVTAKYTVTVVSGGYVVIDRELAYEFSRVERGKRSIRGWLTVRKSNELIHNDTCSVTVAKERRAFIATCREEGAMDANEAVLRAIADFIDRQPAATSTPAALRGSVLKRMPRRLDRPLVRIDQSAYVVTWLPVEEQPGGEITERLVIVRDDGMMFGLDPQHPLADAGVQLRLGDPLDEERRWASFPAMAYARGERPVLAEVFDRLTSVYDTFLDFALSLGTQRRMCRFMALESLQTWFCNEYDNASYFQSTGDPGSGKTKLLEVWTWTSYLGELVTSGSSFATLRDIADLGGALGIDDAEFLSDLKKVDPHVRELVLGGHKRNRATIMVKEQLPNGAWALRRCRAFSPRAFSAIRLPDPVLGSRTIVIPLLKSDDPKTADLGVDPAKNWPCDRERLLADLWATGLMLQTRAREAWDTVAGQDLGVHGRDAEPWRPLMAVAQLLEDHGVNGVIADLKAVLNAYMGERSQLIYGDDLSRLIVQVLRRMGRDESAWTPEASSDSSPPGDSNKGTSNGLKCVLRVEPKKVADAVKAARRDAAEDDQSGGDGATFESDPGPSPEQIGRALTRLRITDKRRDGRKRYRVLTREHLDRLISGHGGEASFHAVDPLPTTVTTGTTDTSNRTVSVAPRSRDWQAGINGAASASEPEQDTAETQSRFEVEL